MERTETQKTRRDEEWDIEELMDDGQWHCEMSLTEVPIIERFHKSLEDAKDALKQLRGAFPERKFRIYHWITTTTTTFVGEEEWIEEEQNEKGTGK